MLAHRLSRKITLLRNVSVLLAAFVAAVLVANSSHAQIYPGANNSANGVIVDADGVLHRQIVPDPTGQVRRD